MGINYLRIVRFITKVALALFLGFFIASLVIQYDDRFKTTIELKVKELFRTTFDAEFESKLTNINLWGPTLLFESVVVTPTGGKQGWTWYCKSATVHCSWLDLLLTGKIPLTITLNQYEADSAVQDQQIAMMPHLEKLFGPTEIELPLFLKELIIRKGTITLTDKKTGARARVHMHSDTRIIGALARTHVYPQEGDLVIDGTHYIKNLSGSLLIDVDEKNRWHIQNSLVFDLPQLTSPTCFLQGTWEADHGSCTVHNKDRTFVIHPLTCDAHHWATCTLKMPFSYMQRLLPSFAHDEQAQGECVANLKGNVHDMKATVHGDVMLRNCLYKGMALACATFALDAQRLPSENWKGNIELQLTPTLALAGNWSWDMHKGGDLSIKNRTAIPFPVGNYWQILPQQCSLKAHCDVTGVVTGFYQGKATHQLLGNTVTSKGTFKKDQREIQAKGHLENGTYALSLLTDPYVLKRFVYRDKQTVLADVKNSSTQHTALKGFVDYTLIRSLLPELLKQELSGQGTLYIELDKKPNEIAGSFHLEQGVIKVPRLYNVLNKAHASFSYYPEEKRIVMRDLRGNFHRGSITSKQATVMLDDHYMVSFAHVPLLIDSLFVSWQKDLFAVISGSLIATKKVDSLLKLEGVVTFDKAQLKENLFSNEFQRSLFMPASPAKSSVETDALVDLKIMTKEPLTVKSSFLETHALIDLTITKQLSSPCVAGTVKLLDGTLKFPYKSLAIVGGSMHFTAQQWNDPFIELTAKNKLKKYNIGLQVSGSVQNPHIRFEASPTLTEEQVVALLLTGAQESSLNLVMPTLIMQNVQQLLFGPAKSPSRLQHHFNSLLKPFSHVKIVPRFSDETGRGGLRGAIEIEVNDQLSAVFEKNFSLSEDIKFEIDYQLSDDVNIRGIQDERGDLGSEVEFRWKF